MHHAAPGGAPLTSATGRPASPGRAVRVSGAGRTVGLVILLGLLAACGGPGPSGPPSSASAAPSPATSATASTAAAAARLDAALAALAPGYRFETMVRIGDAVATTVSGRVHDGASELEVTAAGTTVSYRAVPPKAWARTAGGSWEELDTAAPAGNPLDALMSPTAVEVSGDDDAGLRLVASYPPAALGLAGSDPVKVSIAIAPDGSARATYTSPASGGSATSETTFRADPDIAPITAPSTRP